MHPRIGPSRCGELADVIVDEEGIHTAESRPRLISPASDTEASKVCRALLDERPSRANAEIRAADRAPGGRLCVETDCKTSPWSGSTRSQWIPGGSWMR